MARKIVLYETVRRGQNPIVEIRFDDRRAISFHSIGAPRAQWLGILQRGVRGKWGELFLPSDGNAYMDALLVEFRGGYIRAKEQGTR